MKKSELRQLIRELIEDELNEVTTTGNVAGYETPFAFGNLKKRKEIARMSGYTIVPGALEDDTKTNMIRKKFAHLKEAIADEMGIKWHSIKESQKRRLKYLRGKARHHPDKEKREQYKQAAHKLEKYMGIYKKNKRDL
jgi:hypothetical protein